MKHFIKTSLFLLALMLPMAAMAYDFVVDGVYYKTDLWGDYVSVSDQGEDGGRYSGQVIVPASVTNDDTTYPVTKIDAYAFSNCEGLTGVSMPNSITEIGDHSFENCTSLSNLEIPATVTEIGSAAFEGCTSLTRIEIPADITKIGIWAFQNCTNLTDVYCHMPDPSSVDIGFNVFNLDSENYSNRTLHVPAEAVNAYKESALNDFFGKIVAM